MLMHVFLGRDDGLALAIRCHTELCIRTKGLSAGTGSCSLSTMPARRLSITTSALSGSSLSRPVSKTRTISQSWSMFHSMVDTYGHQMGKPARRDTLISGLSCSVIEGSYVCMARTQFPQSMTVRNSSDPASGIAMEQK